MSHPRRSSEPFTKFLDKCKEPFRRPPKAISSLVQASTLFTHIPTGDSRDDPPPPSPAPPLPPPAPPEPAPNTSISVWENAINNLEEGDRQFLSNSRGCGTFGEVLEETTRAKDICVGKQWKFNFRGKTFKLRDVAENVATWVERFGVLGDNIAQLDPVHAAIPWAGFRFLLQLVMGDKQCMGEILVGLEIIANLMCRCTIYEEIYLRNGSKSVSNLEKALTELYTSILVYFVRARKYYTKNTAARIASSSRSTNEIQDLLNDIDTRETFVLKEKDIEEDEYRRSADRVIEKKVSDESKKLREYLELFEKPLLRIEANVEALYNALNDAERTEILTWLSGVEYLKHHLNAVEGRVGCEWLFKKDEFCQWKKLNRSNILWLRGIPGSGKTKLTSTVIDSLFKEQGVLDGSDALAYFYCQRDKASDPDEIMRTIVKQLSLRDGSPLPQNVINAYKARKAQNFASGPLRLEESFKLILPLIEQYSHTTIVIDALDECDESRRVNFIAKLKRLIDPSTSLVKIFVSSRNDDDIVYQLEKVSNITIRPKDNFRDIKRFVDLEVSNCVSSGKLLRGKATETLKRTIIHNIVSGAHGMFLWVDLQIKEVCDLRFEMDIHERLGKLPGTLEKAYSEIYERIKLEKGSAPVLAEKALMWLLCSCRPLSRRDLLLMVSPKGDPMDEDAFINLFHNLLVVDRQLNIVRFVHLSVREFFEKRFDTIAMNSMAAEYCLSLLNKRRWSPNPKDPLTSIQEYAVLYWPNHLHLCLGQQTGAELPRQLRHFLGTLDLPSKAYSQWYEKAKTTLESMWYLDVRKNLLACNFKHLRASERRPILVACAFGFGEKVKSLWEPETLNASYKNRRGETLLYLASTGGYHWIVATLLEKGADPNVCNGSHHDKIPLYAAITNGHEKVVELLLEKGGNLNVQYGHYGSALHVAVVKGHEGVVRLLLEKGADLNGQCARYGSPLHAAVFKGHERIVELLLEEGADLNAKSGCYENALHAAVVNGRERVVESLLEKGADLNTSFGEYGSALQAAAHKGRRKTVELLLEKGVDVNDLGGRYGTALQAAASGKHVKVVKTLLHNEADVNLKGGEHGDALWAALNSGQADIVQMLLEHNADFNDVDGRYGSPLSAAAINGHEKVVQVLLDSGVDVNVQGGYYGNPLSAACAKGRHKAASALLRKGARINARGGMYGSALLAASISGWSKLVGQLLENGAEVNANDSRCGNALYAAAVNGHDKVVRKLLRAGAKTDIQGGEHGYPLSAAANNGYVKVVDMLLGAGANVNAHGGRYGNPLIAAKRHGHHNVVRMLRREGAVLNSEKLQGLLPHLLSNVSEPESDESCTEETDEESQKMGGIPRLKGVAFYSEKPSTGNESETESDDSASEKTVDTWQTKRRRLHKKVVKILQEKRIPINPEKPKDMWDEYDYESDDELDAKNPNDDPDVEDKLDEGDDFGADLNDGSDVEDKLDEGNDVGADLFWKSR